MLGFDQSEQAFRQLPAQPIPADSWRAAATPIFEVVHLGIGKVIATGLDELLQIAGRVC
jgi:hypothetical protein